MSINEINEQAKESLRKYFKDSQDIQHDDDTKKQLTIEEMYKSVDDEIKEQEKKLEELHQMRHALQHNAKEAFEAVYGKKMKFKMLNILLLKKWKKNFVKMQNIKWNM